MHRRTFIKQLGIVSSFSLLGLGRLKGEDTPAKSPGTKLKVLSCNLRVDLPADGAEGNGWKDRRALCVEVMRRQQADAICLQECQAAHLQYLREQLPAYEAYGLANPGAVREPLNTILFSRERFELIAAGGFWLSERPHVAGSKSWDSAHSRFANWVELKDRRSQAGFRLWNTHLDHRGQQAREKGASMLVEASAAFPAEYPQLLTGDMNAGASNRAIGVYKEGGWVDTYGAIHGPAHPGYTAHRFLGEKFAAQTERGDDRPRIDWIFCRGSVRPVSAAILRDSRDGRYPSDHYFVSAEVELPPSAK